MDTELVLAGAWLAQLLRGRQVLDASSFIGPATKELLATARELVVVTPRAAVADAIGDLVSSPVRAYCAPLTHLPFESHSFDAAVSLEVLDSESLEETIAEFARVLNPDIGILVLSARFDSTLEPDVTESRFLPILGSRFAHVTTVAYVTYLTAAYLTADSPQPSAETQQKILSRSSLDADWQSPKMLVVGSAVPLDFSRLPRQITVPFEISKLQMRIRELNNQARRYEARVRAAEQVYDDNAQLLRQLYSAEQEEAKAFDQRARMEELTLLSTSSKEELSEIRQQLSEARAHIDALQSTLSWRVTRPLRRVRRLLK